VLTKASSSLTDRTNSVDSCRHELDVRQSPSSKDMSTEAKESPLLGAATRQHVLQLQ
jgi:hypothetical protein